MDLNRPWVIFGIIGATLLVGWWLGKGQVQAQAQGGYRLQATEPIHNEATVEWTDWKGRERKMTLHRTIHYG